MKSVILRDKRLKGKKALLFKAAVKKDGSLDIVTNDLITDIVEVEVRNEKNEKFMILEPETADNTPKHGIGDCRGLKKHIHD